MTTSYMNDSFSESVVPSSVQNQTLLPKVTNTAPANKQTFPLRVRKGQHFVKGPDCPSIISQSTTKDIQTNQDMLQTAEMNSENGIVTARYMKEQEIIVGAASSDDQIGTDGVYSTSDLPQQMTINDQRITGITIQDEILREYDDKIGQQHSLP